MATSTSAVDASNYDSQGYVRVTWTNAEKQAGFYSWGVWRRDRNDYDTAYGSWVLLYETTQDIPNYEYRDYSAPSNKNVQYSVRQRTGNPPTWDTANNTRTVKPAGTNYWLIHPTDEGKHLLLGHVTSDDFKHDKEEETLLLIGRGRKQDHGTMWGVAGSLKVDFRNRADLKRLIDLWDDNVPVLLRNPFGDVWRVSIGEPAIDRTAGVGAQEFTSVGVSYQEVA
jgi:hypothetical protein